MVSARADDRKGGSGCEQKRLKSAASTFISTSAETREKMRTRGSILEFLFNFLPVTHLQLQKVKIAAPFVFEALRTTEQ